MGTRKATLAREVKKARMVFRVTPRYISSEDSESLYLPIRHSIPPSWASISGNHLLNWIEEITFVPGSSPSLVLV
ncbi:hypothetical protein QC761_208165 [Podospora bellae-mahoneyi]|uniref:Uncharacterized protein n=1 Tax=Podospora bellae-mahoneyi TaxID=2093777 RepID=A0ABR0FT21_9PEZI|nr:hypothetical protein QC761_208165 [Podospora bellae-mahoneyi]